MPRDMLGMHFLKGQLPRTEVCTAFAQRPQCQRSAASHQHEAESYPCHSAAQTALRVTHSGTGRVLCRDVGPLRGGSFSQENVHFTSSFRGPLPDQQAQVSDIWTMSLGGIPNPWRFQHERVKVNLRFP